MRLFLVFSVWCLLLAMPAGSHPPSITSADQEKGMADEIVAWRKAFAASAAKKDASRLRKLYAPTFVHTDEIGRTHDREARITAILAGEPVIELAPADNVVIRMPGGWTAIATGWSRLRSSVDGRIYVWAWTATYVRAGDDWHIAASHATPLPDPQR